MNLPDGLLAGGWAIAGWIALLVVAVVELRSAPWPTLATDSRLHVWLGAIVSLVLLWSMQAGIKPGLNLHFLGASMLVLAFGRSLAFLALALVLAAVTLNSGGGWQSYGINAVLLAALPTVVAQAIAATARRYLPAHIFVFIFANGFFGAGLTIFLSGAAGLGVLALAGVYPPGELIDEYLPYFMLLGFGEAWLSGLVVTLLVVYRPRWITAFDDRRYLGNL